MDADPLVQIWRASASGRALNRKDVENFQVKNATNLLQRENFSLRAEGHFVFGLSQIWAARAALLLQDSQATDEGIGSAFREYLATMSQPQSRLGSDDNHRSAQLHDFDLDELAIPSSLVSDPYSQQMSAADYGPDISLGGYSPGRAGDLSLDLETRHQRDPPADISLDAVVRSAEEQRELAGAIDLGFDDVIGDAAAPQGLDFGSELDYSSSPPHTPLGDEDLVVDIRDEEPEGAGLPKPARKRRKNALIDEITTISRPTKASSRILRNISLEPVREPQEAEVTNLFDRDGRIAKMLDPEFVYQEMRRRRSQHESFSSQLPSSEPAEELEFVVGDDDGFDNDIAVGGDEMDIDVGENTVDEPDNEEVLTEEMLEADQKRAKQAVKAKLSYRGEAAFFDDLVNDGANKACVLMEVLSLAARGKLRPEQTQAFGAIKLTRV